MMDSVHPDYQLIFFRLREIILVKPQTFMNLSGEAVGSLVNYYKRPLTDLLVIYDDIDIPFGSIRLRASGGSGGHKGMESIIASLGSEAFPRLRIGIRADQPRGELSRYVLRKFSSEQEAQLHEVIAPRSFQQDVCL
jgi:PTH1 family peptidyl-tRNA hydrolase